MKTSIRGVIVIALSCCAGAALAQPESSLDRCQKTTAKEAGKLLTARTKTIAGCLQKISGEIIKSGKPADGAAKTCASKLRKLINVDAPTKMIENKAKAKILKQCDPGINPGLTHTLAQVLDLVPPVVAEGIQARQLDDWCFYFGVDVPINSVGRWIDCQIAASNCQANQQISVEYPRAVEWLGLVRPAIVALGPAQKYTDALTALDDLGDQLDSNNDGQFDLNCGPGNTTCGNGIIEIGEQCDDAALNGATCVSLGYLNGGILECTPGCGYDLSGCISGSFPVTGQTVSQTAGDDGDIQAGPPFSYTDNGDGTVTDNNTGLTWEKKGDNNTIHDKDTTYTWANLNTHTTTLNSASFAGHSDWRIPNRHELASLVHLGVNSPAVDAAFNSSCVANCVNTSCSCTGLGPYWTSTTLHSGTTQAWFVQSVDGTIQFDPKTIASRVRAVRGP